MNRFLCGASTLLTLLGFVPSPADAADAPVPVKAVANPYPNSAIGSLVVANGGKIPATGVELTAALAKLGDFLQLPIPFSAVDGHSGLTHPRVVIAMRPSSLALPEVASTASSGGGWGGPIPKSRTPVVVAAPSPLGKTAHNQTHLEGRLFLAANMELQSPGRPVVKSVEFLSWNSAALKFDFGVIEGLGGGKPELKMLDGARCFSCHKNRGPILGEAPWSNSVHNEAVRSAAKAQLKFPHEPDADGKEDKTRPLMETIDGLALLKSNAVEVDAAIRQGADRLRDRAAVELLAKTETGRHIIVQMLMALSTQKPIVDDKNIRFEMNRLDLTAFLRDEIALQKTAAPNRLLDYKPSGTTAITRYDATRATGDAGLPSAFQPSNSKAFAKPSVKVPQHASDTVSLLGVARAIGLSESDRSFLALVFERATSRWDQAIRPTSGAVAKEVFSGASFADVIQTGVLPDRDDFKDRVVAGLVVYLESRGRTTDIVDGRSYATAPIRDPNAKPEAEKTLIPSHACLACHDVRGAKSAAFSPIPMLAFDPFDSASRTSWLKTADRVKKTQVLTRLVQRMTNDRDMPPEDSREADLFRGKEFDAVKDWLVAELKKVKG